MVDDDRDLANALINCAAALGYDARGVPQLPDVGALIQAWRPQVIVTDLQMPEVDGVALFRLIDEAGISAKIVIISGMPMKVLKLSEAIARGRGLNVVGTLTKPFKLADLEAILARLKPGEAFTPEELRDALTHGKIKILFQPKCNIATGRVIGFEALARWNHDIHGDVSPSRFVPVAELAGLSGVLLDYAMRCAAAEVARQAVRSVRLSAAVNLSVYDLGLLDLPDKAQEICKMAGIACEQMTLELTEGASMGLSVDAFDVLARLRLKGFSLSIDDFGNGFSSLQRLRDLPFSELKIDRSFIEKIVGEQDTAAIVKAVITMSSNLGINCVAEGIENDATSSLLLEWGCQVGQGYRFGRAMNSAELDKCIGPPVTPAASRPLVQSAMLI